MKQFTDNDVDRSGKFPTIYTENYRIELSDCPLPWHDSGLQQTATGYGAKLTTAWKINYCGKLYRVYATCYSNAASHWFTAKKERIYIN
jgi:hypothetical protein